MIEPLSLWFYLFVALYCQSDGPLPDRELQDISAIPKAVDQAVPQASHQWLSDLNAARAEAKKSGKPVLMFFEDSKNCSHCRELNDFALSDGVLQAFGQSFVLLAVDRLPQTSTLFAEYKISGWPQFVLTDSQGRELARHLGGIEGGESPATYARRVMTALGRAPLKPIPESEFVRKAVGLRTESLKRVAALKNDLAQIKKDWVQEEQKAKAQSKTPVDAGYLPDVLKRLSTLRERTEVELKLLQKFESESAQDSEAVRIVRLAMQESLFLKGQILWDEKGALEDDPKTADEAKRKFVEGKNALKDALNQAPSSSLGATIAKVLAKTP